MPWPGTGATFSVGLFLSHFDSIVPKAHHSHPFPCQRSGLAACTHPVPRSSLPGKGLQGLRRTTRIPPQEEESLSASHMNQLTPHPPFLLKLVSVVVLLLTVRGLVTSADKYVGSQQLPSGLYQTPTLWLGPRELP